MDEGHQDTLDDKASALFSRVMDDTMSIDKARRGLTAKAIYLGSEELRILRAWTHATRYWHVTALGETLAGYPVYRVNEQTHFRIAWE